MCPDLAYVRMFTMLFTDGDEFEELQVDPYSSPPDLPDVMREQQQDNSTTGTNGL